MILAVSLPETSSIPSSTFIYSLCHLLTVTPHCCWKVGYYRHNSTCNLQLRRHTHNLARYDSHSSTSFTLAQEQAQEAEECSYNAESSPTSLHLFHGSSCTMLPSCDQKPLATPHPSLARTTTGSAQQSYFNINKETFLSPPGSNVEFDPCVNAAPYSPFYNHDTPRTSCEQLKSKSPLHVQIRDLEAQDGLTPTSTKEKGQSVRSSTEGRIRIWPGSRLRFGPQKKCMTKPKPRSCQWMANLPRWQRILVKLLIALVVVGAMVGIGVGVSMRVGGGVYRNQDSTTKIGSV